MKKYVFAILAFSIVAIGVGFTFAQRKEGGNHGARPFGPPPFALENVADELNLTTEQRAQIKQIIETGKTTAQTLMENSKQTHEQLKNLGTDGVYNEEQVAPLASQQAETTKQLIIEKEKTKAAIFAVLTPEQRTQAAAMKEDFDGKMRGRFGKRFGRGDADEPRF